MQADDLDIPTHGAALFRAVLSDEDIGGLLNRLGDDLQSRPGWRLLLDSAAMELLTATGKIGAVAAGLLGPGARAVRAVLFDKTQAMNWVVAWHQDRTIAVRERRDTPDFGPWSVKDGIVHVAPPIDVLNQMVTLRVHLDAATTTTPLCSLQSAHIGLARWRPIAPRPSRTNTWSMPVTPMQAMSGPMRPRSCMPLQNPSARDGAASCKSIIRQASFRAILSGLA